MNRCSQVQEVQVEKRLLADWMRPEIEQMAQEIQTALNAVVEACKPLIERRFVMMKNKRVWFDRKVAGLYPKLDKCTVPYCQSMDNNRYDVANRADIEGLQLNGTMFASMEVDGIPFVLPSLREAQKTFHIGNTNPYLRQNGIIAYNDSSSYKDQFVTEDYRNNNGSLKTYRTGGGTDYWYGNSIILIPICRLNGKDGQPLTLGRTLYEWLKHGLVPEGLPEDVERQYIMIGSYPELLSYLYVADDTIYFMKDEFMQAAPSGTFKEPFCGRNFYPSNVVKSSLLSCDKRRANLSPYSEMYLTDINKGHWELFESLRQDEAGGEERVTIPLPQGETWTARPPQMDVKENGICAIDFGTKSTVVVCQDTEARLLRIGTGDVRKAATEKDYENPTVIELRDIEGFRAAYSARSGRPFTQWEQLTVSHQAENALKEQGVDSSAYDAVFSELKQWANEADRHLLLKDRKGRILELPPYLELADDAFDPIEIYAYYLGLYINNLRQKIYLDYILSFPVNYSQAVREKLLQSFTRGLKKSLPPAILADSECMDLFRVYAGASEPAAYAAIALKALGLEPKTAGELTAYGVFDFGGGTTDFDFGIESIPENRRKFRFEIHQFGRGGDVHLGGEHLLDLLAYDVFVQNLELMRKEQLTIVRPHDGSRVAGTETLILESDEASQIARMNRKVLAEALRPVWEHSAGYDELCNQPLTVNLFRSDGDRQQDKVACTLTVDVKALEQTLRTRIDRGVTNFFSALYTAFHARDEQPSAIHILLAGNSCKSTIVQELFSEHRAAIVQEFAEKHGTDAKETFVIHPPLGMQEAEGADGVQPTALDQAITGKTGVAFGLLRSRKGGRDVRFINQDFDASGEARFAFFLGDIDENDHFHVRIGHDVGYGVWARFIDADQEDFELYYTSEATALQNKLAPRDVKMVKCRLRSEDASDDEAVKIYIRKVKPDTIEYATGTQEEFEQADGAEKKRIYTKTLKG